jgi:hypothetical protein
MDSKSMTRKDFFLLTFTLVGSAVVASSCGSSGGGGTTDAGRGGSGGGGGGSGGGGGGGAGGTGGRGGSGGVDAAVDTPADTGADHPADAAPDTATACTLPLPEEQLTVAATDNNTHTHTVVINGTVLAATTAQTVNTSSVNNHTHPVVLTPATLATLRSGSQVDILSGLGVNAADAGVNHTHTYRIACHALSDAGGQ